ncbi:hypothetical protein [Paenibacillus polymyxa]|uniref:hypothetical protein n=1 Tax=Paenibacillus polymyxa TaxID=1406 RepID=UPI001C9D9A2D|nr:hypothetical protein [Paenibacillus polymyxa]MBY7740463.1 hypothetical protein [Paenibacillus polymyxa]
MLKILVHAIWLCEMEATMRDILSRQFQNELIALSILFHLRFFSLEWMKMKQVDVTL